MFDKNIRYSRWEFLQSKQKTLTKEVLQSDNSKYLRRAKITRVDPSRCECDVKYLDGPGGHFRCVVSFPFYTPQGFGGGMPQVGSHVLVGFIRENYNSGRGVIVGYLPFHHHAALNHDVVRIEPKKSETHNPWEERFSKFPLTEGQQVISALGSDLYFGHGQLSMSVKGMDEIKLRSDDHTILFNSLNFVHSTEAALHKEGLIIRGHTYIESPEEQEVILLEDGRSQWALTDNGVDSYDSGSNPLCESTHIYFETCDAILPIWEDFEGDAVEEEFCDPIVTQQFGNVVGIDFKDPAKYGRVLRPYRNTSRTTPSFEMGDVSVRTPTGGTDSDYKKDLFQRALCYKIELPRNNDQSNQNSMLAFDKEGRFWTRLGRTWTSDESPFNLEDDLGAGRSWEASIEGSLNWIIGKNWDHEHSWHLETTGSIRWDVGLDDNSKGRGADGKVSLRWTLDGSLLIEVDAPDKMGYGVNIKVNGNARTYVNGNSYETVIGEKHIHSTGNMVLKSDAAVYINGGPNVWINSSAPAPQSANFNQSDYGY